MIRFLTLITFLFPIFAFAPDEKKPDVILQVDADKMTSDNLGNVYLIKAETISKYDSKGILQKTFSDKDFGAITSADATNALRIILFYKDFNRIVILDNMLSQDGDPIQLEALGFPLATLVAYSHDDGIWIYDQQNFELLRFNSSFQIEQRTGNLAQLLGMDIQPNFLIEKDNHLLLNNPSTGILVFDIYGTYSKTIPIKYLKTFQVNDDHVIYFHNGEMTSSSVQIGIHDDFDFAYPLDTTAKDMRLEKKSIFVLKEKQVEIYNK